MFSEVWKHDCEPLIWCWLWCLDWFIGLISYKTSSVPHVMNLSSCTGDQTISKPTLTI